MVHSHLFLEILNLTIKYPTEGFPNLVSCFVFRFFMRTQYFSRMLFQPHWPDIQYKRKVSVKIVLSVYEYIMLESIQPLQRITPSCA